MSPSTRIYRMKEDDERLGLRAGDLLECEPYWLDPPAKLTVLQRLSDGFDPECNVYRYQVEAVPMSKPTWRCARCGYRAYSLPYEDFEFEDGSGTVAHRCPECRERYWLDEETHSRACPAAHDSEEENDG